MRHIKRRFFYILLSYLEFFFGDSLLHLVCNLRVVFMSKNCSLGIWMSLEQMLICENEIYSKRQNFSVESGIRRGNLIFLQFQESSGDIFRTPQLSKISKISRPITAFLGNPIPNVELELSPITTSLRAVK